jgi:hypothetical protein
MMLDTEKDNNMGKPDTVTIEGARLIFRNFAGKEQKFNPEGSRNFCVILPDDVAEAMLEDGWNVNYLKPREEGDAPTPYLQVAVRFDQRPPKIVMITSRARVHVDEDMVETLDWADIANVDMVLNPYSWSNNMGESGVKAYLKTMFVTIEEDELERKYALDPEMESE